MEEFLVCVGHLVCKPDKIAALCVSCYVAGVINLAFFIFPLGYLNFSWYNLSCLYLKQGYFKAELQTLEVMRARDKTNGRCEACCPGVGGLQG